MALLPPPDSAFETHAHRASRGVDVVIPVWRGAAEFGACLAALHNELPPRCRIVVVNDASPDIALCALLARHEAERRIVLVRHPTNRGFPAAANSGLRRAVQAGHDALLLNPDTLPPAGAIQRLAEIAYGAADIGSVTPMSNDGSLVSYAGAMGIAGGDDVARLDAAFRLANGRACIEIPTGVGFCMYVRHDCLLRTGFFREDMFAQGYGEENDWCLRARHLGWRHVAATGVFVAHLGGRSFGAVKADLMARNISLLNRLYPGYDAAMRAFAAQDPLAPSRRAVDAERWSRGRCAGGAVVMVAHGRQGGVGRVIGERAAMLRAQGIRPIILSPPDTSPRSGTIAVADDGPEPVSDLVFDVHNEREALVALLAGDGVQLVEWHHFLGHGLDVADFAARLGVGFDFFVHDSALWCPRVTMTDATGRYCGEPADVSACASCVRDLGSRLDEDIAVSGLRARSRSWLRAARRVVVPCEDAEWRIARQFPGIQAVVTPWEDDAALADAAATTLHPPTPRDETVDRRPLRIVTVGAVGPEKGYQVLLDCARDAARRRLPLEFVVVGYTSDDARLIETDRVFVTGRFAEGEAAGLVAAQRGDLGFIPSLWPETWCYALTALWRGALPVACFALGAQAERVARANVRASAAMNAADPSMTGPGGGVVLPLGLPAPKLNDLLLSLASARRHRCDAVAIPARSLPLPAKSH